MYAASNKVIAIITLISLSKNVPSGKNIGNITEAINKTVIKGTPLQNSINPIEEYLITGNDDLLPRAKNIPTGKQKRMANIEIINVKDKPPHSLVAIFSRPKLPPDKSEIKMKGNTNRRKIIIYFLIF
tara:strand:+ start:251 stop:634 length:384 start_codon:yes stop_codon:yes gene_type:complete